MLELAQADLEYYDKIIEISRDRFKAGDIAQIDLDRIELLRVQYEVGDSDGHRQPAHRQDSAAAIAQRPHASGAVRRDRARSTSPMSLKPLEDFRQIALDDTARPAGGAADRFSSRRPTTSWPIANGSTDPTFGAWYTWNSVVQQPQWPCRLWASA